MSSIRIQKLLPTLALIGTLAYAGFFYDALRAIAPVNWYHPPTTSTWSFGTSATENFFGSLEYLPLVIANPVLSIGLIVSYVLAYRNFPSNLSLKHLWLFLPLLPIPLLTTWSTYVSTYQPWVPVENAHSATWETRILHTLMFACRGYIAVTAAAVLSTWQKDRSFAMALLWTELIVLYCVNLNASFRVTNFFL